LTKFAKKDNSGKITALEFKEIFDAHNQFLRSEWDKQLSKLDINANKNVE